MKLLDEHDQEVTLPREIPGTDGHSYFAETLVDHWEVGPMVLACHESAGAHLVSPAVLGCRIERTSEDPR